MASNIIYEDLRHVKLCYTYVQHYNKLANLLYVNQQKKNTKPLN